MKFLRYFGIIAMVFAAVVVVSCKKDKDDEEEKEYLNGTIKIDFPKYVTCGDIIHVVPTGVYAKDESDTLLAFSWYNPITNITDTIRLESDPASKTAEFDFKVSADTTGSFTMVVSAWAEGYYVKTTNVSFTVVDPALGTGSIKGFDFLDSVSKFTDARDGMSYYYHNVAGKDWMIQNLAWKGAGIAYMEAEAMSGVFGRYYTWDEASSACPSGWKLPSNADYTALAEASGLKENAAAGTLMVDATFNGSKMWEFWPEVKITNSSRFSAIPVGYAVMEGDDPSFKGLNEYALFWTSGSSSADMGIARYIYVDKAVVYAAELGKKSIRASVRCVR